MNYLTRNNGMNEFRREFDRLFDDFWSVPALSGREVNTLWSPLSEVEEEGDHYMLTLEVPGMRREDLKIEVADNSVTISGERKQQEKKQQKGDYYSERRFGKFYRSFALPTHVDSEKIEAQYQDGVLKVYVPKAESAKPRQIKIGESSGGVFNRLLGKKDGKENAA